MKIIDSEDKLWIKNDADLNKLMKEIKNEVGKRDNKKLIDKLMTEK